MSSPLVLLVSRSASRTQVYREALDARGISCLAIAELKEVAILASGTPLSGVLLDMPVLIKASPADKTATEDILKALPSAYLNIAPATDSIKLLTADATQGIAKSIDEFAELCKGFTPRLVRPKDRYPLHLQALLTTVPEQDSPERTVTLNISPKGCFLFTSNTELQLEQQVSIQFIGLNDTTPITATICWLRLWGTGRHHIPGIGVNFTTLSESQQAQIIRLLEPLQPH
ncbi:PilZ domain-containing protein [Trichlorobacter thiogenes]|uniref:PilZ domain-containing protein n=1 Tax=Trichlorobacter thiogenes TaxID=115783 RepID=A0A1T4L6Y5_9BACT|nr:PilZ domain-containing protein [Trichlorobacter thiogenes]SJZ50496.1 PilZ domain-containing protein [Trichlorobacter thiogenes]